MLFELAFFAAVTAAAPRPEMALPEPITRNARLLRALGQADDDFATVQKELGLVGAAPLVGLKTNEAPVRPQASRSSKPRVQKASAQVRR